MMTFGRSMVVVVVHARGFRVHAPELEILVTSSLMTFWPLDVKPIEPRSSIAARASSRAAWASTCVRELSAPVGSLVEVGSPPPDELASCRRRRRRLGRVSAAGDGDRDEQQEHRCALASHEFPRFLRA